MSQWVIPNVQEIRPTVQINPLQVVLSSVYLVTGLTAVLCVVMWLGWRWLTPSLPAPLEALLILVVASVPIAVFFVRLAAISLQIEIAVDEMLRLFTQTLLVASAVALPLVYVVYQPNQWLPGESTVNRILGYGATVGTVQMAVGYLLLRLLVWENAVAKHRVLMSAVTFSLAQATAFSVAQFLLFQPSPDAFAVRLVFQHGVHLISAAMLSYLLFQMRHDRASLLLPVILLGIVIVFIGTAISLRSGLSNGQITVAAVNARPLIGLLFSVTLSIVGAGACWFLMTQQERSKSVAAAATQAEPVVYNYAASLSFRQRWSHYAVLGFFVVLLALGFVLRDRTLNRAVAYQDVETGIGVLYPANWLLDRAGAEYVFRVRDMRQTGFKTTIQVSVIPIGPETSERNIADQLAVQRARQLIDYRLLSVSPTTFKGVAADVVTYTFVSRDPSPFLESIPAVVFGEDIILFSRGQAIVLTFRADVNAYQQEYSRFQRFLSSLEL